MATGINQYTVAVLIDLSKAFNLQPISYPGLPVQAEWGDVKRVQESASPKPLPNASITFLQWSLPGIDALTPSLLLIIIIYLLQLYLEATGRVTEHPYGELAVIFQGGNIYLLL